MNIWTDMKVLMDDLLVQGEHAVYRWTLHGSNTGPGGTSHRVRIGGFESTGSSPSRGATSTVPPTSARSNAASRTPSRRRGVDKELVGQFLDAAVRDQDRARQMFERHPDLLNARWILGETALHFLAVEDYVDGARFLARCGAAIDATNDFGDTALIDIAALGNDAVAEVLLVRGESQRGVGSSRQCFGRSRPVRQRATRRSSPGRRRPSGLRDQPRLHDPGRVADGGAKTHRDD